MTDTISQRDLEALSAYLDGELTPRERQRLEIRLEQDGSLRTALEEFRGTQAALRNAPYLRAPRNFTLTPEMAGVRERRWTSPGAFNMLRFASALAMIFLVFTIFGEWFTSSSLPGTAPVVQQISSDAEAVPSMGVEPPEQPEAEEIVLPENLAAPEMEGGPEEPVLGADMLTEPAVGIAKAPRATEMRALVPTQTAIPTQTPAPTISPQADDIGTDGGWPSIRFLQVALLALAILAGAAAYYFRPKTR